MASGPSDTEVSEGPELPVRRPRRSAPMPLRHQGAQTISQPLVTLNVSGLQNTVALRYQTW